MFRDALIGSISIFDNYDIFLWYNMVLLYSEKTLVARNYQPLFVLLSAYIFMFNKTILLFHLFLPLLSLFMSIVMQYFVNSNLHVSTL